MYSGFEYFTHNNEDTPVRLLDFWQWAYSDFSNPLSRAVLAEFIVASGIGVTNIDREKTRIIWRPFDLLSKSGYRVEVKYTSYIHYGDVPRPGRLQYTIHPARLPDEGGDYDPNSPMQRNCDLYVFCLFKGITTEANSLDLDLWEFYVLPTEIINISKKTNKTITYNALMELKPIVCDYYGLEQSVDDAMNAFTNAALCGYWETNTKNAIPIKK